MTGFVKIRPYSGAYELIGELIAEDTSAVIEKLSSDLGEALLPTASTLRSFEDFSISYMGDVPLAFIKREAVAPLKRTNWMTRKHVKRALGVTGFVKPLVLDKHFNLIDGYLRLELVEELAVEGHYKDATVPAVVLDVDEAQAALLRILLNRTSEFPRWDFKANEKDLTRTEPDLPTFVDDHPQLQKILDPLGFYCQKIMKDEAFADTILALQAPPERPVYKPGTSLLEWAEIQREWHQAKLDAEHASPLRSSDEVKKQLLTLKPKKSDFVEVYEIEEEVSAYIQRMKEVANTITINYDAKRKAEKEAAGQAWQGSRRTSKKVIADVRAEVAIETDDETLAENEEA